MKIKLRIKTSDLVIFLLTILIIRPQMLVTGNAAYVSAFAAVQSVAIVWFLLVKRNIMNSPIVLIGIMFYAYSILNTILRSGFIGYFYTAINGVFALLAVEYLYRLYGSKAFFRGMARSMFILLAANFVLTFLGVSVTTYALHNSARAVYFLGVDNQVACHILIGLLLQYLNYIQNRENALKFIISCAFIILNLVYFASGTLIISIVIGAIMLVISRFPKFLTKMITPFSVSIVLVIVFIILTLQQQFNFMAPVFALLGKDSTLSRRTVIWNGAYLILSNFKNFMFGLGEQRGGSYIRMASGISFSAHNLFLQLMLEGGIILLMMYIVMWIISAGKIMKQGEIKQRIIICSFILVYFIACMTEVFPIYINIFILHVIYLCSSEKVIQEQSTAIQVNVLG